ncbi:CPBP family intramembrane metalloprotease [Solwaraspora sp. WMMD406]|uniref:CPBP family intramembrane glutamic endopeptidase n=1 Tax=Solwaraspora sp. WMMD406 TaxID=3016095 RepID=UPI00241785F9|nr:CPBP family intramembrane glutamic endopeptidase [Solwaraspora sp. WMMD406]MDG4765674.1 CPBP family intramembrane metalloprotease [Solwaraspora sp. WMMD406]
MDTVGEDRPPAGAIPSTVGPVALGVLAAGLTAIGGALAWLLLTGRTEIRISADAEAGAVPLSAVVIPLLVGVLLTRLVPARLPTLPLVADDARTALVRQTLALLAIAVAFPLLAFGLGPASVWYGPVKVALLIGGTWWVLRSLAAPSPGAVEHRRAIPAGWYWLGPLPAMVAWGYLSYYSPLRGPDDLSGYRDYDPVFLAGAMVLTFLTAGVVEEVFYRAVLQTRLEALLGRWPAIVVTAVAFAAMHTHRIGDGPLAEVVAVVLVFNGGFGLFVGYLWARYRNIWALIVTHGAVNSITLLPIFFE